MKKQLKQQRRGVVLLYSFCSGFPLKLLACSHLLGVKRNSDPALVFSMYILGLICSAAYYKTL